MPPLRLPNQLPYISPISRLQGGDDARLGDGDGLLLHRLVRARARVRVRARVRARVRVRVRVRPGPMAPWPG